MLIHSKLGLSTVNGPGTRAVIWFQGCSLGCKGCWNPETHSFEVGSHQTIEELVEWIGEYPSIEGVTFSGGEPMQQADELIQLCWAIRKAYPHLSLGMFSGYCFHEIVNGHFKLRRQFQDWGGSTYQLTNFKIHTKAELGRRILNDELDFAVLGRYVQRLQTSDKPMCGSSNQTLELFGDRYKREDFRPQEMEVRIQESGLVTITGFPPEGGFLAGS